MALFTALHKRRGWSHLANAPRAGYPPLPIPGFPIRMPRTGDPSNDMPGEAILSLDKI